MANNDHLELLRDLEGWNDWRRSYIDRPDLSQADLGGRSLDGALLYEADLQGATLSVARLGCADLRAANLQEANLNEVEAENAQFQLANVARAEMNDAQLRAAKFNNAILSGAKVRESDLSGASMRNADCRGGDFRGTRFKGADLLEANFGEADLRNVKDFYPNATFIRGAQFSPRAGDWWSVLRRSYTGPKMVFNLLFLTAFLIPYAGKALFWTAVNHGQAAMWQTVTEAQHMAQGTEAEHLLAKITPCLGSDCQEWPVWQILIGVDRGSTYWVLASVLLLFNVLRGVMTWVITPVRDEEERSGYSPDAYPYARLLWLHYCITVLGAIALFSFTYHMYQWLKLSVWLPK